MREFDHNGLLLAEYQAKLFEKSYELPCSSAVFLRRFQHSNLLKRLDANNAALLSPNVMDGIDDITEQFGPTESGKVRFSKDALFWMGYMYRYIAYTRDNSTPFIMRLFPYKQLNELFYTYHTQDPEWCVRSLLELHGLTEDYFDCNYRLKQAMSKRGTGKLVCTS